MNTLRDFFRSVFGAVDVARRVFLNLVFFAFVVLLLALLVQPDGLPSVEDGMALVIDPEGLLVEEYDADPFEQALDKLSGREVPQVLLRDLVDAIERAADDDRIDVIVLDLSALWPAGLSKLQDLRTPLQAFRDGGKRVVAYANGYGQSQYYLAAVADEVHTHPMGGVFIDGFGTWRTYMREALDKLMFDWHVFKAGDYKSFLETYTRDDMSPEARQDTRAWLDTLWSIYIEEVEQMRELEQGAVQAYADGLHAGLEAAGGDLARYALDAGLVDHLTEHDGFEARMRELVGDDGDGDAFHGIGWRQYLEVAGRPGRGPGTLHSDGQVAVLVMRGVITSGDPGMSAVGAERVIRMLRGIRRDPDVKALVVRIDSPGGSAFASDLIRRELERFREDGRPLVVSMSSVAASGGYWIATPADEIWARPTTVTGSIGVISMFPTYPRTMEYLGLTTDGLGTTRMSGAFRPDRHLSEPASSVLQSLVDGVYAEFIERVARGRDLDAGEIEEIAQGRVWSGQDAQLVGLVDRMGGVNDAVASAAALAGIEDYSVNWIEPSLTFRERMLLGLLESRVMSPLVRHAARSADKPLARIIAAVERELSFPFSVDDPRGIYLYCFCAGDPPVNPRVGAARSVR